MSNNDETLSLGHRLIEIKTAIFESEDTFYERAETTNDGENFHVAWRFRKKTVKNNTLWSFCSGKQKKLLEQAFTLRSSNLIRN